MIPEEVIHQHVKFLLQHGELYPTVEPNYRLINRLQWIACGLIVSNLILFVELLLK